MRGFVVRMFVDDTWPMKLVQVEENRGRISSGYTLPTQKSPTRNVGQWKGKKITSIIARALKKRKTEMAKSIRRGGPHMM